MPGFNGTGPRGEGPMTGGARGYCAGTKSSSSAFLGGFGTGRGNRMGMGRGMGRRACGMGRGMGYGARFYDAPSAYGYSENESLESSGLKSEISSLKGELSEIKSQLKSILNKDKE